MREELPGAKGCSCREPVQSCLALHLLPPGTVFWQC